MADKETPSVEGVCSCGSSYKHGARNLHNTVIHNQADLEKYARDHPNKRSSSEMSFNTEIQMAVMASTGRKH